MMVPSNFWTPTLKAEFHQTIASLRQLTEIPSEPRDCRGGATTGSRGHTLSIEDEIRTADSIAFLAHHEEGAKFVSTVTLRECPEGLQVVLAGNTTPSSSVIDGLMRLTARLSKLSREGSLPSTSHGRVLMRSLKVLVNTLNLVEHPIKADALRYALEKVVVSCSQVARLGNTNSVEEHLKSAGVILQLSESPEIRQVDKLARYFFACRDLARVASKPDYRRVFRNIDVRALDSPSGVHRPGTAHYCFVHAEIQQIFDLEQ
ncbi:hypothetical protein CLIM01_12719 [Colletotrichum limetticola]|uniref:Uncharacterized protein n=1 Tax=Colletotrichum limetticola TaxID=1209924 RepID=A0ABQ9PD33_9PEZI|nr:hypothetical protein CLIM01_12719 [Colletotrichum limetticola]